MIMLQRYLKYILIGAIALFVLSAIALFLLARKEKPEEIQYGISFNTPYAEELGLAPRAVFDAFIDELGAKRFRLAAHWSMVEPEDDQYDFSELDYQLERVQEAGGEVILGVGRRLPRWPECHVPGWAQELSWEEQKREIREYIETVVARYRDESVITHWQVENEPYLEVFAYHFCGDLDEAFLKEEVALVKSLDPSRDVLLTDSGNLGTWAGAYQNGDLFGTSMYVYFWNPELGQFKTVLPPWFYRVKEGVMELLYGEKETVLIELSAEPWLLDPISDVSLEVQYSRMDIDKFNEIIEYAKASRFEKQYLWGGEWWYWLREQGNAEMWERGKELFQ